jgi:NAD(P)-dependent dehydrogenase (short-subunit alcohol dehydrogenase family)
MTDESAVRGMARGLLEQHRRIDVLVNNAGANIRKGLLEADSADWRAVLEMDLTACFALAQELAPGMIEAGCGRIINIGSVSQPVGWRRLAGSALLLRRAPTQCDRYGPPPAGRERAIRPRLRYSRCAPSSAMMLI